MRPFLIAGRIRPFGEVQARQRRPEFGVVQADCLVRPLGLAAFFLAGMMSPRCDLGRKTARATAPRGGFRGSAYPVLVGFYRLPCLSCDEFKRITCHLNLRSSSPARSSKKQPRCWARRELRALHFAEGSPSSVAEGGGASGAGRRVGGRRPGHVGEHPLGPGGRRSRDVNSAPGAERQRGPTCAASKVPHHRRT